ncbi:MULTISPECIES: hypothetical protein [Bradyrhizobium]|nr:MULTISPECIES: hypothetical protein [Bradyrhizobium]
MKDDPVVLLPGMLKPLRLARVYGLLVERIDGLYHPGEPTEQGMHAAE